MKKTKLILTRAALVLFAMFLTQAAWAEGTQQVDLNSDDTTIELQEKAKFLYKESKQVNGQWQIEEVWDKKTWTWNNMTGLYSEDVQLEFRGSAITPRVRVLWKGEHDITSEIKVTYTNNVMVPEDPTAPDQQLTITIEPLHNGANNGFHVTGQLVLKLQIVPKVLTVKVISMGEESGEHRYFTFNGTPLQFDDCGLQNPTTNDPYRGLYHLAEGERNQYVTSLNYNPETDQPLLSGNEIFQIAGGARFAYSKGPQLQFKDEEKDRINAGQTCVINLLPIPDTDIFLSDFGWNRKDSWSPMYNADFYRCFTLKGEDGSVYINPMHVDVEIQANGPKDKKRTYDGTTETYHGYSITSVKRGTKDVLALFNQYNKYEKDYTYQGQLSDTLMVTRDNGTYQTNMKTGKVKFDNIKNFTVDKCTITEAGCEVEQRYIHLSTGSKEWEYDGTEHSYQNYELKPGGVIFENDGNLVTGETAEVTCTGKITDKGNTPNTADVVVWRSDGHGGTEKSANSKGVSNYKVFGDPKCWGTLTVTPKPVTATGKTYTITVGDPLPEVLSCDIDGIIEGDEIEKPWHNNPTCDYDPETSEPGEYPIFFVGKTNGTNPDVVGNYEYTFNPGKLIVEPDVVTVYITGNHNEDVIYYDGNNHVVRGFTFTATNSAYTRDMFTYNNGVDPYVRGKETDKTYMQIDVNKFQNLNNLYDVEFVLAQDGYVEISCFPVVLGEDGVSVAATETDPAVTNAEMIDYVINTYGSRATVTLSGRTLYKDGGWNTICLPFDVTLKNSPLANADVRELSEAIFEEGTLTLNFTEESVKTLEAGKPYIIKWAKGTNLTETDLVFEDVDFVSSEPQEVTFEVGNAQSVVFKGTYAPVTFEDGDDDVLLVGAANTLYTPGEGAFVNAQRAYFQLVGEEAAEARAFVLSFGGATNISNVSINAANEYFDLSGRRVVGQPTQKGIYIVNGKKVVVK